jgi:hypothetical protein
MTQLSCLERPGAHNKQWNRESVAACPWIPSQSWTATATIHCTKLVRDPFLLSFGIIVNRIFFTHTKFIINNFAATSSKSKLSRFERTHPAKQLSQVIPRQRDKGGLYVWRSTQLLRLRREQRRCQEHVLLRPMQSMG